MIRGAHLARLALAWLMALAACGGGGGGSAPESGGSGAAAEKKPAAQKGAAATPAGDPTEVVTIPIKNENWTMIKRHFLKYRGQKHAPPKNIYENHVTKFQERPVIEEAKPEEAVEAEVEIEAAEERGPLEQYPLKDYQVVLIQSGTAVPKAFVVDPKGNGWVITVDQKMGDKSGVVEAITQYMVVVREPDSPDPAKLQIKPPFMDLVGEAGFEGTELKPPAGFEPPAAHLEAPKIPRKPIQNLRNLPR
jgi:hypothetical protein